MNSAGATWNLVGQNFEGSCFATGETRSRHNNKNPPCFTHRAILFSRCSARTVTSCVQAALRTCSQTRVSKTRAQPAPTVGANSTRTCARATSPSKRPYRSCRASASTVRSSCRVVGWRTMRESCARKGVCALLCLLLQWIAETTIVHAHAVIIATRA